MMDDFRKLALDLIPLGALLFFGYFLVKSIRDEVLEAERILNEKMNEDDAAARDANSCPDFVEERLGPIEGGYNPYLEFTHTLSDDEIEEELIESPELATEIANSLRELLNVADGEEMEIEFDADVSLEEADAAIGPDGDRIIFAITPSGEVVSSFFSEDNMKLAKEIAKVEDKSLDDVLLETIAVRYDMKMEEDDGE